MIASRKVHLAGVTANPTGEWVAQQARNLAWELQERALKVRYLLRDRESKFAASFDQVFRSEGVKIVKLPYRSPRANSIAERFMSSCRREALDHLLIFGPRHLEAASRSSWSTTTKRARAKDSGNRTRSLTLPSSRCLEPARSSARTASVRTPRVRMGGLIELAEMVLRHTRSAARRLDRQLFAVAGTLAPPELRSLDALHIAAALTVSQDLADFVTYDARIISAAQAQGLPVVSPS